jgi:hypothetical protein
MCLAFVSARPVGAEPCDGTDWALQIDNDLLTLADRDADFTGGVSLLTSLDVCSRFERALLDALGWSDEDLLHAGAQLGVSAFTPPDLKRRTVDRRDRPYANLAYVSLSRTQGASEDAESVMHSTLTLGMFGTSLGQRLHSWAHETVGDEIPQGYRHEISRGGEPSFRYTLAHHALIETTELGTLGRLELQRDLRLSAGYITQASASATLRLGQFSNPWWRAFPDESVFGVNASDAPDREPGSRPPLYLWASLKLSARLYNSMLQGQFRRSEHRIGRDDLETLLGDVALGLTW